MKELFHFPQTQAFLHSCKTNMESLGSRLTPLSPRPTMREAANLWTSLCTVHDGVAAEDREWVRYTL